MKRLILSTIPLLLFLQPIQSQATTYPMDTKVIIYDGKVISSPKGLAAYDGNSVTTYMPIWYVMQMLNQLNIQSSWDGTNWQMTLPPGQNPNIDYSKLNPGSGAKQIYINGTLVQKVNSIAYPDPASGQMTTYIPIWYIMNILNYNSIASNWDGHNWTMTTNNSTPNPPTPPTPPSQPTTVDPSGVSPVQNFGKDQENWWNTGFDVNMNNLSYSGGTNQIPVEGKVNGADREDVVVEVYHDKSENWFYSLPVAQDGSFSGDITVPYGGTGITVAVGIPVKNAGGTFGLNLQTSAYMVIENDQSSLNENQLALLQSWMTNYNESPDLKSLAQSLTNGITDMDTKIQVISDWASKNIRYNYPSYNQGLIPWQQATQTYQLKYGVCQDYTSITSSMLRSLGIPTEDVSGEAFDPQSGQDLGGHQWDKAWDGTKWISFDPTWDQSYTGYFDYNSIPDPSIITVTHTYFNQDPNLFALTHRQDATNPFDWSPNKKPIQ